MIALSVEATSVAHGIHYAVLAIGFAGLLALLGPQLIGVRGTTAIDDHDRRVQALTAQIASGGLGVATLPTIATIGSGRAVLDRVQARLVPMVIVSSAAAAGIHAAVGPAHFREGILFGLFFAGSSLAQIGWSIAMLLRPSRSLLTYAIIGNAAVLALWLTTRTVGLPALLPTPEAVGPWDVTCGAWEVAVIVTASQLLRADAGASFRLPAWADWDPVARAWALGSAALLLTLTLIGASA